MIVAYIDNKRVVFDPDNATDFGWSTGHITTTEGEEYYIFDDREQAGEMARAYWEDLAQDDPREFACLVGEETLVQWGMGQYAAQAQSLSDWLDLWLNTPEEHFASYDGKEQGFKCKHPDWENYTVAYRHN